MTKRYAILQKKLAELESLAQVFSLPHPQTTACPHLLSDDFHQRFLFLTNLLQAEIASHPSKPHHLAHIAHRLTQLESAFQNWDHHDSDSLPDGLDAVDTCSCTESCLDDDSEEREEMFYEAVAEEEDDDQLVGSAREEEERGGWGWRCLGAMGGGMVVGAVVMGFVMVTFSGCFDYVEYQACLVPT